MKEKGKYEKTRKTFVFFIDIIIYHISFVLAFFVRYNFTIPLFNYRAYENASLYIMISFGILNVLSGMYILYNKRKIDVLFSTVINQLLMMVIVTTLTFIGRWFAFPRTVIVISFVISTILLGLWRVLVVNVYQRISGSQKIMVLGKEESCKQAIRNFEDAKNDIYIVTMAAYRDYYKNVKEHLDQLDIVYITSNLPRDEYFKILSLLTMEKKKIFMSSTFENLSTLNSNIMNIEDETFLELTGFTIPPESGIVKRFIDILISLMLIIITAPIFIVTAILVKTTSAGPIFYKQVRITKDQKKFNILKFRTMGATAEKDTGPVLATSNDTRVTPIGKYLRSLRIDELPQLINVLKGEMSLVGPRPERPYFVEQFQKENPYYYLRHSVRAGITGYAQVNGKYATDFNNKLKFDLLYIKDYSVILDIQILLQTIKTLFDKMSSKGLDEDEILEYKVPSHIKIYH